MGRAHEDSLCSVAARWPRLHCLPPPPPPHPCPHPHTHPPPPHPSPPPHTPPPPFTFHLVTGHHATWLQHMRGLPLPYCPAPPHNHTCYHVPFRQEKELPITPPAPLGTAVGGAIPPSPHHPCILPTPSAHHISLPCHPTPDPILFLPFLPPTDPTLPTYSWADGTWIAPTACPVRRLRHSGGYPTGRVAPRPTPPPTPTPPPPLPHLLARHAARKRARCSVLHKFHFAFP